MYEYFFSTLSAAKIILSCQRLWLGSFTSKSREDDVRRVHVYVYKLNFLSLLFLFFLDNVIPISLLSVNVIPISQQLCQCLMWNGDNCLLNKNWIKYNMFREFVTCPKQETRSVTLWSTTSSTEKLHHLTCITASFWKSLKWDRKFMR